MVLPDSYVSVIEHVCNYQTQLRDYDAYYRGRQRQSFWRAERGDGYNRRRSMVVNLPRLIVDSLEDRLDVEGFTYPGSDAADASLWGIWQANDLDEWSQQAHLHALIHGRSYVLVGGEAGETPTITVESSRQVHVEWDHTGRKVLRAAKVWSEGDRGYATFFDGNFTTQWWATSRVQAGMSSGLWRQRAEPIPNLLGGVVPVVPFVNRPDLDYPLGQSELVDVAPLADAINEMSTDMLETAEALAAPLRYASGVDVGGSDAEAERTAEKIHQKVERGPKGKIWAVENDNAKFGQFDGAPLSNFIGGINLFTGHVAAIASLPPHFLGVNADNPASAEAINAAESSLIQKVRRKQRVFGGSWERVMRLALLVRDGEVPVDAQRLETKWRKAETPTVAQVMDAAVKAVTANIADLEQAREDVGYSPVQIQRMKERAQAAATAPERARIALAKQLEADGLTQNAALAAAGLLQAAALNSAEQAAQ